MLKIAICDDDRMFTGSLETLILTECRRLGIRVETDVFDDGKSLVEYIGTGKNYSLIFYE